MTLKQVLFALAPAATLIAVGASAQARRLGLLAPGRPAAEPPSRPDAEVWRSRPIFVSSTFRDMRATLRQELDQTRQLLRVLSATSY